MVSVLRICPLSVTESTPFYLYPGLQLWLGHQHVHGQALAVEGVQLIVQQSTRDGHTVHNLCCHTERACMKTSRSLRRCLVTTHENRRNDGQQLRSRHPRPLDVQEHVGDVTSVGD